MSASRSFEAFNPYSGKSKYFYLRDKYRHKKHHCHSCGANVPSTSNECHSCREKMARDHHQYEIIEADHNTNEAVSQDGDQYSFMDQESAEMIWVKESCNITVDSTDTQVGVSLQASLQLAITLVLNIAIGNTDRSEAVSQDLIQSFNADQINKQKIFIYNTKDATVTTRDTDLAVNIQVLLQLLLVLVVMVDIL